MAKVHARCSALMLVAVALPLAACAAHHTREAPRPGRRADVAGGAIDRASARLDSAGRAGDVTTMAGLFLPAGELFAPGGANDTARGPDAVAARLDVRADPDAEAIIVTLTRAWMDDCRDGGALQAGIYSLEERRSNGRYRVIGSGPYRLRWRLDDRGEARIETLALGTEQGLDPVAHVRCPSMAGQRYDGRHLFVSVLMPPFAYATWPTATRMHALLVSRGWSSTAFAYMPAEIDPDRRLQDTRMLSTGIAARARIWRMLFIEAYAPLAHARTLQEGWNPGEHSFVVQTFVAREGGALLAAQWHRLRIGAGPALVHVDWQNSYDEFVPLVNGGGQVYWPPTQYQHWRRTVVGTAAQVAYSLPASSRSFVEVFARVRRVRGTVPALGTYPSWVADFDGYAVGLRIGAAPW